MKRIQILSILLLATGQQTLPVVPKGVKAPARAITAIGDAPTQYTVVYTKITKDPKDQEGKPVVIRTQKSTKPAGAGSAPINEELAIPQADIILSAGALPDAAAKIAGFIDPRAGAAVKAGSAILDEALNFAGQELSKKYKLNSFEIKLIELLPTQYYEFDDSNNSIKVKPAFLPALEKYTQILANYDAVAKPYNKAAVKYNKLKNALPEQRPPPNKPKERADWDKQYQEALNVYNNELMPELKKKVGIESQLTEYALHRVALMASQDEPGDGCKATGEKGWEGPWSLYLYYFLGSKQTNRIKVDFCAQKGVTQDFAIRLNRNDQDDKGNFVAGGVNLEATSNNTIKFPVEIAAGKMNWNSKQSAKYSWFDDMITNENGGDIATYLYPYDLFNLEQKRLKEQADKNDARTKENVDKFNGALDELDKAMKDIKDKKGIVDKVLGGSDKDKDKDKGSETPAPGGEKVADNSLIPKGNNGAKESKKTTMRS